MAVLVAAPDDSTIEAGHRAAGAGDRPAASGLLHQATVAGGHFIENRIGDVPNVSVTQHASLSRLVTTAPTVIPWTQIAGTVALCALVALATASAATWSASRRPAIETVDIRE
ncbi:hypothetical protein GCM10023336_05340 [Streptomyces similanensis]|uniref:ABC transporter permease n=1 Tax=Streptomyces similanensis TaxID=1274988 RepID=A0ABP9JVH5_9ACTN